MVAGGEDFAGVDTDPDRQADAALFELRIQVGKVLTQFQRRSYCAEGIVLATQRDTEDGHDGIADEAIDCAAVSLD